MPALNKSEHHLSIHAKVVHNLKGQCHLIYWVIIEKNHPFQVFLPSCCLLASFDDHSTQNTPYPHLSHRCNSKRNKFLYIFTKWQCITNTKTHDFIEATEVWRRLFDATHCKQTFKQVIKGHGWNFIGMTISSQMALSAGPKLWFPVLSAPITE